MTFKPEQDNLKKKLGLAAYDLKTLKYLQKPIGRALYNGPGSASQKVVKHWTDILQCKVCGRDYKRSNYSNHRKTQVHNIYERMNEKIRKLLLEEEGFEIRTPNNSDKSSMEFIVDLDEFDEIIPESDGELDEF